MRAESLRARLTEGPATWAELVEATGWSEQRCMVEVSKLQAEGAAVRLRSVTFVDLLYDPQHPVERLCAEPGCTERLRHTNGTGYCTRHVQGEAASRWRALPANERRVLAEEVTGDPASWLALFDTQLALSDVDAMVGA